MKKGIFILILFFFIVSPTFVNAADTMGSGSAMVSPTPIQVDYTLPYPGLLPDNPLYTLKVLRDRVISFFISDPLKKSQFSLLQADKRLQAAYYLEKEGSSKDSLVSSTLSKGENYFDESLSALKTAKDNGEDVNPELAQLMAATLKHEQVIQEMVPTASSTLKTSLQHEYSRVQTFGRTVATLSQK